MSDVNRVTVFERPGHVGLETRPMPGVAASQVLINVAVCGICGSDIAAWRGEKSRRYPYTPGHEFCGTVEAIGVEVDGFAAGRMVVVDPNLGCGACRFCDAGRPNLCAELKTRPVKSNGGLSDYVALDHRMAHPLPAGVPVELAPFIEPLSCACHGVRRLGPERGGNVAVFGAGTVGLLTALVLQDAGATVVTIEPSPLRRIAAGRIVDGCILAPGELDDSGHCGRLDGVIDCSGNSAAVRQAVHALREGGRLVLAGIVGGDAGADVPLELITRKELDVVGTWLNPGTFGEAVAFAARAVGVLGRLTTETFALRDIAAAFERATSPEVHKVMVKGS